MDSINQINAAFADSMADVLHNARHDEGFQRAPSEEQDKQLAESLCEHMATRKKRLEALAADVKEALAR